MVRCPALLSIFQGLTELTPTPTVKSTPEHHPMPTHSEVGAVLSRKRGHDLDDSENRQQHPRRCLSHVGTENQISSLSVKAVSPSIATVSTVKVSPASSESITKSQNVSTSSSLTLPKQKSIHLASFLDALRARAAESTSIDQDKVFSAQPDLESLSDHTKHMGSSLVSPITSEPPVELIDLTDSPPIIQNKPIHNSQ